MKYILVFTCCVAALNTNAQQFKDEINAQVWRPFIQSFNDHDTKAFMSIHSKDVVRSPRDAKLVWNYDEYYKNQENGDKRELASGSKRQLELRFTERIANNGMAVEVGVYKTTMTRNDGTTHSFYGRFHVVMRKENGIWKILVDTDSSESGTIDEQDFMAAQPME